MTMYYCYFQELTLLFLMKTPRPGQTVQVLDLATLYKNDKLFSRQSVQQYRVIKSYYTCINKKVGRLQQVPMISLFPLVFLTHTVPKRGRENCRLEGWQRSLELRSDQLQGLVLHAHLLVALDGRGNQRRGDRKESGGENYGMRLQRRDIPQRGHHVSLPGLEQPGEVCRNLV